MALSIKEDAQGYLTTEMTIGPNNQALDLVIDLYDYESYVQLPASYCSSCKAPQRLGALVPIVDRHMERTYNIGNEPTQITANLVNATYCFGQD